ncbi:hypothetical protein BKA62DRAFT_761659 [Auriculariales sp. MPI-PUGE-AT-0066]|nr:hypothetical protein BKA62DRAFT_761659 [Auriculariales sp. MPI-PUGE-AT-0066]
MFFAVVSAFTLAAVALGAPTERACSAIPFTGHYNAGLDPKIVVNLALSSISEGTTVTVTVVDLATCTPYTGSPALTELSGWVLDVKALYGGVDPSTASSVVEVKNSNTVTFVSSVPSGAKELFNTISATLSPYSDANAAYVKSNVGVLISTN